MPSSVFVTKITYGGYTPTRAVVNGPQNFLTSVMVCGSSRAHNRGRTRRPRRDGRGRAPHRSSEDNPHEVALFSGRSSGGRSPRGWVAQLFSGHVLWPGLSLRSHGHGWLDRSCLYPTLLPDGVVGSSSRVEQNVGPRHGSRRVRGACSSLMLWISSGTSGSGRNQGPLLCRAINHRDCSVTYILDRLFFFRIRATLLASWFDYQELFSCYPPVIEACRPAACPGFGGSAINPYRIHLETRLQDVMRGV